jgi:hypothetical protein
MLKAQIKVVLASLVRLKQIPTHHLFLVAKQNLYKSIPLLLHRRSSRQITHLNSEQALKNKKSLKQLL